VLKTFKENRSAADIKSSLSRVFTLCRMRSLIWRVANTQIEMINNI